MEHRIQARPSQGGRMRPRATVGPSMAAWNARPVGCTAGAHSASFRRGSRWPGRPRSPGGDRTRDGGHAHRARNRRPHRRCRPRPTGCPLCPPRGSCSHRDPRPLRSAPARTSVPLRIAAADVEAVIHDQPAPATPDPVHPRPGRPRPDHPRPIPPDRRESGADRVDLAEPLAQRINPVRPRRVQPATSLRRVGPPPGHGKAAQHGDERALAAMTGVPIIPWLSPHSMPACAEPHHRNS